MLLEFIFISLFLVVKETVVGKINSFYFIFNGYIGLSLHL